MVDHNSKVPAGEEPAENYALENGGSVKAFANQYGQEKPHRGEEQTDAAIRNFEREIKELTAKRRGPVVEGDGNKGQRNKGQNQDDRSGTEGGNRDGIGPMGDSKDRDGRSDSASALDGRGGATGGRNSLNLHEYFRTEQEEKARSGIIGKHVGLIFEDLSVVRNTFVNPIVPNSGLSTINLVNPVNILKNIFGPVFRKIFPGKETYVLKGFTGIVKDGEMCLVLGRAGSGCTTFLKAVGLVHSDFKRIEGKLELAGIGMKHFKENFRGEVLYNPDKDGHIPILTVGQTLDYALMFKTPGRRVIGLAKSNFRKRFLNLLLTMFKIQKLENSMVGNEFIRGISGGERRRLTIAEMLAAGNAFSCWDNLTNGLDSSTAFEVVRALRILTDITNTTTIACLCQASENIYSLFDKVLLIDRGMVMYFGPADKACSYFESLGYMRSPTEASPDFLLNVVDINARKFDPRFDVKSIPVDPESLRDTFLKSDIFQKVKEEINEYRKQMSSVAKKDEFIRAVLDSKSRYASKYSTFTVSYFRQILILTRKHLTVAKQNKLDAIVGIFTVIVCSLLIGLGFFQMEIGARGMFVRSSSLLMAVAFNALQHYADLVECYQNRLLVERHKNYRFYCASADKLAYFISTIPRMLIRVTLYTAIVYPMTGLKFGQSLALISFFFTMAITSLCVLAIFMLISCVCKSFAIATRVAPIIISMMFIFSGFIVSPRLLSGGLKWIYHINPLKCGFVNCVIMEFKYITGIKCNDAEYIPNGPGYDDPNYKFCSLPGGGPGENGINGLEYLRRVYDISESDYWPNVGIILGSTLVYLALVCFFSDILSFSSASSSVVFYKKPNKKEAWLNAMLEKRRKISNEKLLISQGLLPPDSEVGNDSDKTPNAHAQGTVAEHRGLETDETGNRDVPGGPDTSLHIGDNDAAHNSAALTASNDAHMTPNCLLWRHVVYTVNATGKELILTNNVSGYANIGQLMALMGCSGAGKTTLLDVICSRKTIGVINGDILLGGSPIRRDDFDKYAYCEQIDMLSPNATVREALRFSAYLRQSYDVPRAEKNRYVEELISLLELESIADAVIGSPMLGSGLDLGKRKLVSIGIELASRPSMVLVLDEPTTGLDSKSADEIIRLLKKLAQTGLMIICTIHQPNTTLFEQFDNVLLMMSGGRTAYFGPIGKDSSVILEYFKKRGAVYDGSMSPPEFVIDVIEAGTNIKGGRMDWAKEWEESEENRRVLEFLDRSIKTSPTTNTHDDSPPPYASVVHPDDVSAAPPKRKAEGKKKRAKSSCTKVPVPWIEQVKIATRREMVSLWRQPNYSTSRIFNHVILALITGLAFTNADNSVVGIQTKLFSFFQIVALVPMIVPIVQARYFAARMIFNREESAGTYSKSAFAVSLIISEIPLSIVSASFYAIVFYLPSKLKNDFDHAIFYILAANIMEFFTATLGLAISALTPSVYIASKFFPCIFIVLHLYSGVISPYSTLPAILKYTLYWINPLRWLMSSLMESEISDLPVRCNLLEFAMFNPPSGLTCGEYMRNYLARMGVGYVYNPESTSSCMFCSLGSGDEFLKFWSDYLDKSYRIRDLAIFTIFIVTNVIIILLGVKFLRFVRR